MTEIVFIPTPQPKLARDWVGGIVETTQELVTGWLTIPAGTLMEVTGRSRKINLSGFACSCCGIRPRVTLDSPHGLSVLEWRGKLKS